MSPTKKRQKAVITLQDAAPGRLRVRIDYEPDVPGKGPIKSAAVQASLEFLKFLADHQPKEGGA